MPTASVPATTADASSPCSSDLAAIVTDHYGPPDETSRSHRTSTDVGFARTCSYRYAAGAVFVIVPERAFPDLTAHRVIGEDRLGRFGAATADDDGGTELVLNPNEVGNPSGVVLCENDRRVDILITPRVTDVPGRDVLVDAERQISLVRAVARLLCNALDG